MKGPKRRNATFVTPEGARCCRCRSMMVYEKYYGLADYFWGWRCVCCGDIIDSIILENRSLTEK